MPFSTPALKQKRHKPARAAACSPRALIVLAVAAKDLARVVSAFGRLQSLVVPATSPADAYLKLCLLRPAVLVVDLCDEPKFWSLIEKAHKRTALASLPIFVLTRGRLKTAQRNALGRLQVDCCLLKPFNSTLLRKEMERLLRARERVQH